MIGDDHLALRARRQREVWCDEGRRLNQRHSWQVEGIRGEVKTWHGLAHAVRRELVNMQIQAHLSLDLKHPLSQR